MYNKDIYKHLDNKFGAFNMLLICQGISEMYKCMAENSPEKLQKEEFQFESNWWNSAEENVVRTIDNENTL